MNKDLIGTPAGEHRTPACDMERCPACGQQKLTCGCDSGHAASTGRWQAKPLFEHATGLKCYDRAYYAGLLGEAEERLRLAIADVPKRLKRLCLNYWFPGECFPRAIYFLQTNPKLTTAEYILGEATTGGRGQHGWVEFEDLVFDPVLQEWYRKDGYYTLEAARPWYRFSRPAAVYLARQMGKLPESIYRWDCWLRLPWGKDTPISLEQARAYLAEADAKRKLATKAGTAANSPTPITVEPHRSIRHTPSPVSRTPVPPPEPHPPAGYLPRHRS